MSTELIAHAALVQRMTDLAQYSDEPYLQGTIATQAHAEVGAVAIFHHRGIARWGVVQSFTATHLTVTYMTASGITLAARRYADMLSISDAAAVVDYAARKHGEDSPQHTRARRALAVIQNVRGARGAAYTPITTCTVHRVNARIVP